jgi:DNA-binding LacI/PurR family transcriptional regulator
VDRSRPREWFRKATFLPSPGLRVAFLNLGGPGRSFYDRAVSRAGGSEPTIRNVAERAGVSKSLVSLVLRGSPKVSDQRRQAVLDAIRELGYRPNAAARSLSERRTHAIGVLLGDLRNPWYAACLEGLTAVLVPSGLTLLLAEERQDSRPVGSFMDMRVDGLVLLGSTRPTATIAEAVGRIPTVAAGSRDFDDAGLPMDVSAQDDRRGAEIATEHLIGLGHRRVAHLASHEAAVARIRLAAYRDTVARHGLAPTVVACDMTESGGHRAARELLSRPDRPTAIFCVNDMSAIGALTAAAELGLSVPRDLSLVGYDNTHLAELRPIGLTSIDIASRAFGEYAARLLLRRIDDPRSPAGTHLAQPSLAPRATTAPPP